MHFGSKARFAGAAAALILAVAGDFAFHRWTGGGAQATADAAEPAQKAETPSAAAAGPPTLALTDAQLQSIKIEPVGEREFPIEKDAVGSIDFDEETAVQVFPPYQGRIVSLYASVGDTVKQGQTLFTIQSPDLIQAESTLIAAAATLDLTSAALARARKMATVEAIAQKDLEQAASDQQAADGALKAARDAVSVFGKTDDEIKKMISARKIDPLLVVPSPLDGKVTARNAQPGLLVQPGNPPAPYSVADPSIVWMLANVTESDSPSFAVGQTVKVSVMALPGRTFDGKIATIGATVDPNTHTVLVRSAIADPKHELRPGMLATFLIDIARPEHAPAVPVNGVVREGDGTMTVWVTTDRHHFTQRVVKVGLQHDGFDQIVDGLQPGDLVATDGALFLDNKVTAGATD
jgi:cobalt-zinc-cadmium efflux system membrane fusion protein